MNSANRNYPLLSVDVIYFAIVLNKTHYIQDDREQKTCETIVRPRMFSDRWATI